MKQVTSNYMPYAGGSGIGNRPYFRHRKMNEGGRAVVWPTVLVLLAVLAFFAAATLTEYRPEPETLIFRSDTSDTLPDTVRILTWNIGYAGLGDNMDFFYDGGRKVRDTKERTEANLRHILRTIRNADADIILLQEVDLKAKRSYFLHQWDSLKTYLPEYASYFAYNYKSPYVPIPLREPIGRVESGVVLLSRFKPLNVRRLQYPSAFSYPTRLFNLKRGVLSAAFVTGRGDTVVVNNTHNTAYDAGNMRAKEMEYLSAWLGNLSAAHIRHITGGDWNQFPPDYPASEAELTNPYFVPARIDSNLFEKYGMFVYDTARPSLRYLDKPLHAGPVQTLTDFFFLSYGLHPLSITTLPENHRASDHDPILMEVAFTAE